MTGDASAGTISLVPFRHDATCGRRDGVGADHAGADRDDEAAKDGFAVLLIDGRDRETAELLAALSECDRPRVVVEHISDPKEAEHVWLQGRHDLVIVDVWLERGISVELVTLLTSSPCTCPIVMLSSLSSDELKTYFTDSDLFIHSKRNITPGALSQTLGAALALDDEGL